MATVEAVVEMAHGSAVCIVLYADCSGAFPECVPADEWMDCAGGYFRWRTCIGVPRVHAEVSVSPNEKKNCVFFFVCHLADVTPRCSVK